MTTTHVSRPQGGTPPVYATATQFRQAAQLLAAGKGPIALDAERASSFRYGERAFLIQAHRAGTGTILIAPEADRAACSAALAPVLNGHTWVLHSAHNDLPCLKMLGLEPGDLIDTEIAALMLHEPRTGLGALVEANLNIVLEKAHSNEDWSRTPLPRDWLDYAALDVEYLLPLAEIFCTDLKEEGKLEYFQQECAFIVAEAAHAPTEEKAWNQLKGAHALTTATSQRVAAALDAFRHSEGAATDTSVQKILPNKALIAAALRPPSSIRQLRQLPLGRRIPGTYLPRLLDTIAAAKAATGRPPRVEKNHRAHDTHHALSSNRWRDDDTLIDTWDKVRDTVETIAEEMTIDRRCLPNNATLKAVTMTIVDAPADTANMENLIRDSLQQQQARPWQIDALAEPLAALAK
ncbi:HRDC domain-containing protein [Corynebacterium aquilae]|uniref:HRDC domain-containing protein n=1 Tax=Corynebacterium aquilae TaxID=203263 RepID=UPI000951D94C|nr:HRDC domain-containing protein [Corynebacterium aquilae]